jgi:phenylacetate-CoA ligase
MNFFNIILRLKGFPINEARDQLIELQNYSYKYFIEWSDRLRWDIFQYHYQNNGIYRKFVNDLTGKKPVYWEDIPILKKNSLPKPIYERLTTGYRTNDVYINYTSGASGQPFCFAKDKFCHAMTWAVILNRYQKHNIYHGKSLQARFYGIPLTPKKYLLEKLKDRLLSRVRFNVYDLSDNNLEHFLQIFNKYRFDYINGYTSSLVLFAKYIHSKGVRLKEICPTLKVTIPTSEILNHIDRDWLFKGFGVPVVNEYGASEFGIIAFEDENQDWILSDENLWIEVIDEHGNQVPPGIEGRIIITSCYNRAMPFIRYEMGDIGSIAAYRKGNNQVLKSLQGRTNDIAILPSGKKSPGSTFTYMIKSLLEGNGGIKEFIIKQLAFDLFHFEYIADNPLTEFQKKEIQKAMDLYLEPGLRVTFSKKDKIQRTQDGKLNYFQYLVNSD